MKSFLKISLIYLFSYHSFSLNMNDSIFINIVNDISSNSNIVYVQSEKICVPDLMVQCLVNNNQFILDVSNITGISDNTWLEKLNLFFSSQKQDFWEQQKTSNIRIFKKGKLDKFINRNQRISEISFKKFPTDSEDDIKQRLLFQNSHTKLIILLSNYYFISKNHLIVFFAFGKYNKLFKTGFILYEINQSHLFRIAYYCEGVPHAKLNLLINQ